MSKDNSITAKLPHPPIDEERIKDALESKMNAIYKHEDIIWKVRAGYLAILYSGLTLLVSKLSFENTGGIKAFATGDIGQGIFMLILWFSLSAFLVDVAYLGKKIRIIVIRDMIIDATYNPSCKLSDKKLYKLLQVGSERPLKKHFHEGQKKWRSRMLWNIMWILLPIYAVTPLLALSLRFLYRRG